MESFEPINIDFILNNPEVARQIVQMKDQIMNGSVTAQKAADQVVKGLKLEQAERKNIIALIQSQKRAWEESISPSTADSERLGKSVNGVRFGLAQITREFPAFANSAQTGFMALSNNIPMLIDQVGLLKQQNDALIASGQKAPGVFKTLVGALFSWQTALSIGVTLLTVYGKEIFEWVKALFKSKDAVDQVKKSIEYLNQAADSNEFKKAIADVNELRINIDLAKKGFIDKTDVVEQYNSTIGKTMGQVKSFAELQQKEISTAPKYIEMLLYKAAAMLTLQDAAKDIAEAEKKRVGLEQKQIGELDINGKIVKLDIKSANTGDKQLNEEIDRYRVGRKIFEKIKDQETENEIRQDENRAKAKNRLASRLQETAAKIAKENGLDLLGNADDDQKDLDKAQRQMDKILAERKDLADKLLELDREYSRKSFTKDEEELQALRDKFTKVRELIDEFNKDPKNKGVTISVAGLDPLQKQAEGDLSYRQDTNKLKVELDKQLSLYQDYEETRLKLGEDKAKEGYKLEYKSYADYLRSRIALLSATPATAGTGPITERLKILNDALEKEVENEAKQYVQLLSDLQSYEQKRQLITETYQKNRNKLIADGKTAEAAVLDIQYKEDLNKLDDTNVQKLASYKKLLVGIERLSDKQAMVVIANAETMLNTLKDKGMISAELAQDILNKINDSKAAISSRLPERLDSAASSLRNIADAIGSIDEGFGQVLSTISQVVAGFGELQRQKLSYEKATTGTDKLLAGAGMAAAGIGIVASVVGGVTKWFKGLKEAKEKAKADIKEFYDTAKIGELQYQASIRERGRKEASQHRDRLAGLKAEQALLKAQTSEVDSQYQSLLKKLQGEQYVQAEVFKRGNIFRKSRTETIYGGLAGMSYDQIENLYAQGKLTEGAKSLFEQLKKLKEEGVNVAETLEDIAKEANKIFTGTTADSLTDTLAQMFEDGKTSAQDFANFFEESMSDAALSIFKNKVLADLMDQFYQDFATKAKSGEMLTADEITELQTFFQSLTGTATTMFEDLKKVTGLDLNKGSAQSTTNTLSGAVRGITADQADLLAGQFGGLRLAQLETNQIQRVNSETMMQQLSLTKEHIELSVKIEANTKITADVIKSVDSSLKSIDNKMNNNTNAAAAAGRGG